MAEGNKDGASRAARSRRRTTATGGAEETTEETTGPLSGASDASTGGSSATTSTSSDPNPLGLERDRWTPPQDGQPADLDDGSLDYVPPPPELLEWTPERAGAIVRAGGFLLHTADPVAKDPIAAELEVELWRATEDDVDAIAPPLARILNRYAPARRLAGVSDEMELAFGMIGYLRENLADRGRVLTARRRADEEAAGPEGTMFGHGAP